MTINLFGLNLSVAWPPFGGQNQEVRRLRRYERNAAGAHARITGAKLSRGERMTDMQLLEAFRERRTGKDARKRLRDLRVAEPYHQLLVWCWMYGENIPESAPRQSGPSGGTRRRKAEENGPKDGGHFLPLSL